MGYGIFMEIAPDLDTIKSFFSEMVKTKMGRNLLISYVGTQGYLPPLIEKAFPCAKCDKDSDLTILEQIELCENFFALHKKLLKAFNTNSDLSDWSNRQMIWSYILDNTDVFV